MTSSILDALTRSLGSAAFAKAASTYGESEPAVAKGFTVAVAVGDGAARRPRRRWAVHTQPARHDQGGSR